MQALGKCEELTGPRAGHITFKRKNSLANRKAEEKWNWQGSGSAATTTTIVRCKIVNHQLQCSKSKAAFFSAVTKLPEFKDPLKCSQYSLYRPNLKPAPDGSFVAQHITKRCWLFLSKRGRGDCGWEKLLPSVIET